MGEGQEVFKGAGIRQGLETSGTGSSGVLIIDYNRSLIENL